MQVEFKIGQRVEAVEIPEENLLEILHQNKVGEGIAEEEEIYRALQEPVGAGKLCESVCPGQRVAIVTSDITRPMPSALVLPFVLRELREGGVENRDIVIVFGLGSHRSHTEEEKRRLVGAEVFENYLCVDSDPEDFVCMGMTKRGTPVEITRRIAEADYRICLGNIEYHYFAGYSGGAKAMMPGVSTRAAIQANHSHMAEKGACAGKLWGNPVREDIEEAGQICGIDYIVNVVLDEHKRIVKAVTGDVLKAHQAGCAFLDTIYRKPLKRKADIVIVSPGGEPKDLNLYQAQKALDNAGHAVAQGGIIILAASCKEGLGGEIFAEWLLNSEKSSDLIPRIQKKFTLGGHKAAAIAMILKKAEIYLVSDLEDEFVEKIFFTPKDSIQTALQDALEKLGRQALVLAMPCGGSTLPVPEE